MEKDMLLTQERFEADVLGSAEPVLVDFYATWCGPCKNLAPVVEKLASEGYRVCKVDIEGRPDLASRFGVTALPTLVVLKDGQETGRFVSVQAERTLKAALDRAQAAA
jgi:thioredoxin 1